MAGYVKRCPEPAITSVDAQLGAGASDAVELGGQLPDAFSQTITGAATVSTGGGPAAPLLSTPEGDLGVSVGYVRPGIQEPSGAFVVITNNTENVLPAVKTLAGQVATSENLNPGPNKIFLPIPNDGTAQLHLQPTPVPGPCGEPASTAVTLMVSAELWPSQNGIAFVGQLITGAIG
jgi:hypothetical protein